MAIPESQLATWSHQGAVITASTTANSIKSALELYRQWPRGISYDVYLQGSYKNDTNIRGDSDVDVIAQLHTPFMSNLTEDQKRSLNHIAADYRWQNFRDDVLTALRLYYGPESVFEGNKSIKVLGNTGRVPADVIPSITYRKYTRVVEDSYIEVMCFWTTRERIMVINYPKLHYSNGVSKMRATSSNYKSVVRIFKNIRSYLTDQNLIQREAAPSYFIECLIYNVEDANFIGDTWQTILLSVLNWFHVQENWSGFICQNGQQNLFGDSIIQWSESQAKTFIQRVITLWNNWR